MGACCSGYKTPKKIADKWYPDFVASLPKMDGKVVAITGSTTGTGLCCAQTCRKLGATVVLLNRPSERVAAAKSSVSKCSAEAGAVANDDDPNVVVVDCDLASFASVRSAISKLQEKFPSGIDVLVNNAGVMALKDQATEDGFDIQMQVNHLSHCLLTHGILPLLEKAAGDKGEARIVNHSSIARTMVKKTGLVEKYFEKNGGNLGGNGTMANWTRYGQTKLANIVFTHALHDHLLGKGSKVKVVVAHPGIAATNLQVTTVQDGGMPGFAATMTVSQSCNDGAMGIIRGTCAADVNSCDFYGPKKEGYKGPADLLPKDDISAEQKALLMGKSEAACGISFSTASIVVGQGSA